MPPTTSRPRGRPAKRKKLPNKTNEGAQEKQETEENNGDEAECDNSNKKTDNEDEGKSAAAQNLFGM